MNIIDWPHPRKEARIGGKWRTSVNCEVGFISESISTKANWVEAKGFYLQKTLQRWNTKLAWKLVFERNSRKRGPFEGRRWRHVH